MQAHVHGETERQGLEAGRWERALALSLRPRKRAQPLSTNASLAATTATTSTPFALNSSYFWRKGGRWFAWQVGCTTHGGSGKRHGSQDEGYDRALSRARHATHRERAGDGDEDDLLALPVVRAQLSRCTTGAIPSRAGWQRRTSHRRVQGGQRDRAEMRSGRSRVSGGTWNTYGYRKRSGPRARACRGRR